MNSYTLSLDKIDTIVEKLKSVLSDDCIVILRGDLASGKTTFVKNYVKSLGLDDVVTSPTFSLQSIYSNNIYHYDVYNKTLEEFISLGLLEEFDKKGIHFVEWGDKRLEELLKSYGYEVKVLEINKLDDKRQYTINE
ncbi:MAG: tRNA (adenosine(37)-N6)-threonylcarbamoyltransferase complex ATPase subunit type 1 TsaE [Halarcobacter sp.]